MVHGAEYFFFIVGLSNKTVTINRGRSECPVCSSNNISVRRDDLWFSFFFIPLFPVKRGTPYIVCHQCNGMSDQRDLHECRSCRKSYDDSYAYCPHCGAKHGQQQ